MSLKAHIALGTLLGLLLGAGAVAVLSRSAGAADAAVGASERDRASDTPDASDLCDRDESVSKAAARGVSSASEFRRPMRPGSQRSLLQS